MKPDFDWMDMIEVWGDEDGEPHIACRECGYIQLPELEETTLGDLYLAASNHIKEKHEC